MVGIQIVGDVSCANGGIRCIDDVCRFCKVWESKQSTNFEPCSDFGLTSSATPAPTTTAPTPAPLPTSSSAACASQVTVGDNAVGITAVADVSCNKGGVGCFPDVACRFCQTVDTAKSHHLLKCSDFTTATVASVMMAAQSDSALSAQFSKIVKNHTVKWVVAGAACMGVAAVVAMLALAAKRIVRRASSSSSDDENDDDEDAEEGDVEAQEEATNLTADDSVVMTQL